MGTVTPVDTLGWKILTYIPKSDITDLTTSMYFNIAIICLVGLAVIGVMCYFFLSKLIHAVNLMVKSCTHVAGGDLTYTIPETVLGRKDELGVLAQEFSKMQAKLQKLLSYISLSSEKVNGAATDIYESSKHETEHIGELVGSMGVIADLALEQAQDAQNSVGEMASLNTMIDKNTDEMNQLNRIFMDVNGLIQTGNTSIAHLSSKTNETKETTQEVLDAVGMLQKSVSNIQAANELMLHIGEQTNLLSLNASIEAARAGNAGREFAVVAREISALSKQSTEAAGSINEMVTAITTVTQTTLEAIQNIIKLIYSQAESVEDTKEKYYAIATTIDDSNQIIKRFKLVQEEMLQKTQNVAGIIKNLEVIANQNASTTQTGNAIAEQVAVGLEEFVTESKELTALSEQLQEVIKEFQFQ